MSVFLCDWFVLTLAIHEENFLNPMISGAKTEKRIGYGILLFLHYTLNILII